MGRGEIVMGVRLLGRLSRMDRCPFVMKEPWYVITGRGRMFVCIYL